MVVKPEKGKKKKKGEKKKPVKRHFPSLERSIYVAFNSLEGCCKILQGSGLLRLLILWAACLVSCLCYIFKFKKKKTLSTLSFPEGVDFGIAERFKCGI